MKRVSSLHCIVILSLLLAAMPAHGTLPFPGNAYCSVPPGTGAGIKANLLLMLDNSASMYDLAYTDPSTYCVDASYNDATSYSGYFDQKSIYHFVTDRFVVDAPAPLAVVLGCSGACAISNPYLYLEMNSAGSNRTVKTFKASGNFLNWLTMSKMDIEKKVLTGGKYDSAGYLVAETRGCQGRRFVKLVATPNKDASNKELSTLPPITFVVAGPAPQSPYKRLDNLPSGGGPTRIDIYDKGYKKDACLGAVNDWKAGAAAKFGTDVKACMQTSMVELTPLYPSPQSIFLDIRTGCYFYPENPLYPENEDPLHPDKPRRISLSDQCEKKATGWFDGKLGSFVRYAGDELCGGGDGSSSSVPATGCIGSSNSGFDHPPFVHDGVTNSRGFIGCYYYSVVINNVRQGFLAPKFEREGTDYCSALPATQVIDPSATALRAAIGDNLPGYVLDAGIYGLGSVAGTFPVRVAASAPPPGLIQQYSNDINFGAMLFNTTGGTGGECGPGKLPCGTCRGYAGVACNQGSDCAIATYYGPCSGGTCKTGKACSAEADCVTATDYGPCDSGSDGGRIVSYINDPASTPADHTAALTAAINAMTASTWSPLAESFYNAIGYFAHRDTPLRLQSADFDESKPPSQYSCQRNNVLIVSDGISSADRRDEVYRLISEWKADIPAGLVTTGSESSPPLQGSYNLDELTWLARHKNIADFSKPIAYNRDYLSTYVVYTGAPCGNGSCDGYDDTTPERMMQLAAANGGGKYARGGNAADLEVAVRHTLQEIAAGSGTDAAILASGDGNGALFMQEQFYPSRSFDGGATSSYWTGEMQSLWYYIDPFLGGTDGSGSTIREDTDGDRQLILANDRTVTLDPATNRTYASDGTTRTQIAADQLNSLWRAGKELWKREASTRDIRTTLDGATFTTFKAEDGGAATLAPYLNVTAGEAPGLIGYIQGAEDDKTGYRKRSLTIKDAKSGVAASGVWKLGDIVSSTPQLQSSAALGGYHLPAPRGYGDATYASFIRSEAYKNRGTAYVGANDGMLHAFNLGTLDGTVSGAVQATLKGTDLGKERWAFIPKNALPYFKYLADPSYQHLYFVDGRLALFDASMGGCTNDDYHTCPKTKNSWMTVLIGGMGLGGASAVDCSGRTACVQRPDLTDAAVKGTPLGTSSYFALDVTEPDNPKLLWEFGDPSLGYATGGPAIVRIAATTNGQPDNGRNGRWFAVFGSGPTGSVDTASHQFTGVSDRTLKFFVVDLRTGALVKTIDTGIADAFIGSMTGGSIDADKWSPGASGNYQDDAVYAGYVAKSSGDSWTDGGVIRIVTNESVNPNDAAKPWSWSLVIKDTGPVTGGIARLQDRRNHKLWLYFGSGRYFFGKDDMKGKRALYGVKEPCYGVAEGKRDGLDPACGKTAAVGRPGDLVTTSDDGWRINLDSASDLLGAERTTTTPAAITGGAVFFTTFQPGADPCLPGSSYLYGVTYDAGDALPQNRIYGKVLVPLSSGDTRESALNNGGARGPAAPGRPAAAKVVSNSGLRPLRKIIQIQER